MIVSVIMKIIAVTIIKIIMTRHIPLSGEEPGMGGLIFSAGTD